MTPYLTPSQLVYTFLNRKSGADYHSSAIKYTTLGVVISYVIKNNKTSA